MAQRGSEFPKRRASRTRDSTVEDDERRRHKVDIPPQEQKSPPTRRTVVSRKASEGKPKRKRRPPKVPWKKPKDMPKRPLSAYNLFFAYERDRLLKLQKEGISPDSAPPLYLPSRSTSLPTPVTSPAVFEDKRDRKPRPHLKSSGIGFANLAKNIASRWKDLDSKAKSAFEAQAAIEKERYQKEMAIWRRKKAEEGGKNSSNSPSPKSHSGSPSSAAPVPAPAVARRASEPAQHLGGLTPHVAGRRRSLPGPDVNFSFELGVSPPGSGSSGSNKSAQNQEIAEPMDGGSLGSNEEMAYETEKTLQVREFDQPARRSFSEPTFSSRRDPSGERIRSCEELAAEVKQSPQEDKDVSPTSASLAALQSSLDDETYKFLTNLKYG